jgi:hypothetical protein
MISVPISSDAALAIMTVFVVVSAIYLLTKAGGQQ